jgi:transcription elongation factor GreA
MMTTKVSKEGLLLLCQRLETLLQDRARLRHKIAEARQVKDADEFDLIDELTQLALLEKQIAETENTLAHCKETNPQLTNNSTVQLGSTVKLETPKGVMQCKVVSAVEADPTAGRISDISPLGSALLGKTLKSMVEVKGPRKSFTYRVLGIGTA